MTSRALLRTAALFASLALSHPVSVRAQAVSFDEAIGLADRTPAVRAEEQALEERRIGDGRISDITEASRIVAMPGVRALSDEDRG